MKSWNDRSEIAVYLQIENGEGKREKWTEGASPREIISLSLSLCFFFFFFFSFGLSKSLFLSLSLSRIFGLNDDTFVWFYFFSLFFFFIYIILLVWVLMRGDCGYEIIVLSSRWRTFMRTKQDRRRADI